MKALALEDAAGRRAVLITSDFQGVPKVDERPRSSSGCGGSSAWNATR